MKQTVASKVPFIITTVSKCLCPKCPVQSDSACVSEKLSNLSTALKKHPLVREDIPGAYCASGIAVCDDLNPKFQCSCSSCHIHLEYKLNKSGVKNYYCNSGVAK